MKKKNGFSLVELAIVLVIIGLITGGILTGQDLIRASELNATIADANKFRVAVNTFKLKYNSKPGDMTNAQSYWGVNPGCATGAAGTGTQTCNGNGDGLISAFAPGGGPMEQFLVWQHLANAGLISGSYSGRGTTYYSCVGGTNCPTGRIADLGFLYISSTPCVANDGSSTYWTRNSSNPCLVIGAINGGAGWPGYPIFTGAEASSLDTKADDGRPGNGQWRAFWGPGGYPGGSNCAVNASSGAALTNGTAATAAIAGYSLSSTAAICSLQVEDAF